MVRITKEMAEKRLADVSDDFIFRCYDGQPLKNLRELGSAFANMESEVFVHHVTSEKNDFNNWVRDIIGDAKLAKDLGKSMNSQQAAKAVSARITFLESKLA